MIKLYLIVIILYYCCLNLRLRTLETLDLEHCKMSLDCDFIVARRARACVCMMGDDRTSSEFTNLYLTGRNYPGVISTCMI